MTLACEGGVSRGVERGEEEGAREGPHSTPKRRGRAEDADEEWVEAEGGGFQRADAAASLNTRGDGDDDCPDLIDDASDDDCPSPPPSAPNSDDEADGTRYYSGDSEGFSSSNDAQVAKRRRQGRRPSDMPPTPPLHQPDGPSVQPQQTLPESMASVRSQVRRFAYDHLGDQATEGACSMTALRTLVNHFCDLEIEPRNMAKFRRL